MSAHRRNGTPGERLIKLGFAICPLAMTAADAILTSAVSQFGVGVAPQI